MGMEVDKRVVEMQFKNDQFEQGAKESIQTLDKLKKSLDLKGASEGLKNIDKSVKGVSLESLSASVDQISDRFSALGIVGMTVLQNITNSAINAGKQLLASLTIEPINQGFGEYELKMGSIQTIMAGTGEDLQTVNKYLDELNTYADKTIYSFSDMTANIGKFTNAGVKLEDAVKAIQGISNEAAVSGANANEASRAMYNFSQALSAGYVKLIDWKSIENANMATVEFKQALLDTAVAMGTVTKEGDKYITTTTDAKGKVSEAFTATSMFNDSLSHQWMSTEVLTQTLANYSTDVREMSEEEKKAYEEKLKGIGYTEEQIKSIEELGKKAFDSAQDVKTFTQLMDTLKEAAGSGWAKSFEIVLGDFDEAKKLFTEMSKEFGGIIDSMSDARNKLLEGAFGEASKYFGETYQKASEVISKFSDGIASAANWKQLENAGVATKDFKQHLLDAAVAAGKLTKTEDGLYDTGKRLIDVNADNKTFMKSLKDEWLTSEIALDALTKSYEDNGNKIRETGRDLLIGGFKNIYESLKSIFKSIGEGFREVFPAFTSERLYKLIEGFNKLTAALKPSDTTLNNLKRTFAGFFAVIDIILQPIKFLIQAFIELIKFIAPVGDGFLGVTGNIGDFLVSVDKAIKDSGAFAKALEGFKTGLQAIKDAIKAAIDYVKDVIAVIKDWTSGNGKLSDSIGKAKNKTDGFAKSVEVLATIGGVFYSIGSAIAGFFKKIWEGIKWVWNLPFVQDQVKRFGEAFKVVGENISGSMGPAGQAFKEFIERVKNLDGLSLANVGKILQDFFTNVVGTFFKGIFTSLKPLGQAILDFFTDLFAKISEKLNISGKFKPLADITQKLSEFFGSLGKVGDTKKGMDNLNNVNTGLSKFGDGLKGVGETVGPVLEKVGGFISDHLTGILTVLTGVVVVGAIKKLGRVASGFSKGIQAIGKGLSALGDMFTQITDILKATKGYIKSKTFENYVNGIFKIVLGIALLAGIVAGLSLIDPDRLMTATGVVAALAAVLLILVYSINKLANDAGKGSLESTARLFAMTLLISSFAKAILIIGLAMRLIDGSQNMLGDFLAIAGMMGVMLLTIFALTKIAKGGEAKVVALAGIMTSFALSILLLAAAFRIMDGVQNIIQDVIVFAIMIGAMILVVKTLGKDKQDAITASATLSVFGMAIMMIAMSFKLADGLTNVVQDMLIFAAIIAGLVAFVAAMKYLGKDAKVSAGLLISFAGAILIISLALAVLGAIKPERLIVSIVALSVIMGLLMGVMVVSKAVGKEAHKAGALLLGLGVALLLISASMWILGAMDINMLKKALSAITVLGIVFAGIIAVSKIAGKEGHKAGIMLLAMSAALLILSGVIWILGSLDTASLIKGTAVVAALMLLMGYLATLGKKSKVSTKYIITITLCIAVLGAVIAGLASIETTRLAAATAALDSLMICFAVLIKLTQGAKKVNASIFILLGVVAALGLIVGALSEYFITDGDKFLKVSTGVSELLVALGVFGQLISSPALQALSPAAAAKVTAALDIALAMVVGVIAGIGAIVNAIDEFTNGGASAAIEKGLQVLIDIAHGIGEAIGSFIGGIGEGISNSLPEIADNISLFGEKIKPFFDTMASLPDDASGKIQKVIEAVAVLTGSDFLYSLTQFFGGKSFEEFGTEMGAFGNGLKTFLASINDLTEDDLEKISIASRATKALSEAFSYMPTEGGFLSLIMGKSIGGDAFGQQISSFGEALKDFYESVKDLNDDAIKKINIAAGAAKGLTELAKNIPNSGGLLGLFAGNNDIDDFGVKLVGFGVALTGFAGSVKGLTEDDASKWAMIAEGVQHLIDMSNTLENSGGLLGLLAGNNDMSTLGEQLTNFGSGLSDFTASIEPISRGHMAKWKTLAESIQPLVDMSKTLNNDGGFISIFTGDNGLDDLGNQLTYFGQGLASYASSIEGITSKQLNQIVLVTGAAGSLVELANTLDIGDDGGFFELFGGGNGLDNFGDQLGKFGSGIADFATNIGAFDEGTLSRVGYACGAAYKLVDIGNATNSEGLDGFINLNFNDFKSKAENFAAGMMAFKEKLAGFGNGVVSTISAAKNAALALAGIGDAKAGVDGFLTLGFDGFADKAKIFSEGMKGFDTLKGFTADMANSIGYAAQGAAMLHHIGDAKSGIEDFLSISFDGFAANAESFCDGLTTFQSKLSSEFSTDKVAAIDNAYKAVISVTDISNYIKQTTIATEGDFAGFELFTTMLTDRMGTFATNCGEVVTNRGNIDAMLTLCESISSRLNSYASMLDAQVVQSMTDSLDKLIATVRSMESVNEANINAFVDALRNVAVSASNEFVSSLKSGEQAASAQVTSFLNALSSAVSSSRDSVIRTFATLAGSIVTAITSVLANAGVLGTLSSAGAGLYTAIANGFSSAVNNATLGTTVSRIVGGIVSGIKSGYDSLYNAGYYVMAGLASGILSGESLVVNAAASVMSKAIISAQQTAKINSPSKVMMEMGSYLDEGLATGMIKNSKWVENAGEDVANTALDTMGNSLKNIASLVNGDLDMSPVITPVIDTSMVASGLSTINTMFSEQQALKVSGLKADIDSSQTESKIEELISLNKAMLSAIRSGGDIYLNENLIIGRINRRLGAL